MRHRGLRQQIWVGSMLSALLVTACTTPGPSPTASPGASDVDPAVYMAKLAQCLQTGGALMKIDKPVQFQVDPGPGMSEEALKTLIAACEQQLGPKPVRKTDRATAERVYDAYMKVRDRVRGHGYEDADPPSRDTFVEQFMAGGVTRHPYDGLEQLPAADSKRVQAASPAWLNQARPERRDRGSRRSERRSRAVSS
jgi:hypothetical protein